VNAERRDMENGWASRCPVRLPRGVAVYRIVVASK